MIIGKPYGAGNGVYHAIDALLYDKGCLDWYEDDDIDFTARKKIQKKCGLCDS